MKKMVIVRVHDGINFENSKEYKIWGLKSKSILNETKNEVILCFVTSNSATNNNGRIIAFADFHSINERKHENEVLGWDRQSGKDWVWEVNYINLYELDDNEKYKRVFQGQQSIIDITDEEAKELYKIYISNRMFCDLQDLGS